MTDRQPTPDRSPRAFCSDDRGLAYAIILGFCAIIITAALYVILGEPFQMILDTGADHTNSSAAATSQSYFQTLWTAIPLVVVVLVVFGWIVAASREGTI